MQNGPGSPLGIARDHTTLRTPCRRRRHRRRRYGTCFMRVPRIAPTWRKRSWETFWTIWHPRCHCWTKKDRGRVNHGHLPCRTRAIFRKTSELPHPAVARAIFRKTSELPHPAGARAIFCKNATRKMTNRKIASIFFAFQDASFLGKLLTVEVVGRKCTETRRISPPWKNFKTNFAIFSRNMPNTMHKATYWPT